MTASQRIRLRLSQVRQRLNEIAGLEGDAFTDEIRSEAEGLQNEYADLEVRERSAIIAEGEGETTPHGADAEERERRELRGNAKVSDFVSAALTGQGVKGASGEYADAVGCAGYLPLDLLEAPEERAVTPGPADETVTSTRPTVPFAFARTDAAALGIAMPMVAPGEAHYPALTTSPPASFKAKDADAASAAGAFALTKRTPGRVTGQFQIRLEDLALMPSMEMDLRRAITAKLADSLDKQVIDGNGTAPNLSGLFHQATNVTAATDTETFPSGVSRFAGLVDGTHANGWGDVRALIGTKTFEKYAGTFANAGKGDVALYDYLSGKLGLLRVSTRVPAVASSAQKGIAVLGAQMQPVTVPVWKGVELVIDPFSQAGKGLRVITAVSLVGSAFVPHGTAQVVQVHPKLA